MNTNHTEAEAMSETNAQKNIDEAVSAYAEAVRDTERYTCEIKFEQREAAIRADERAKVLAEVFDLELLVKVAAREQRYACVDTVLQNDRHNLGTNASNIQNTPCPNVGDVLKKWAAMDAGAKGEDVDG